MATERTPPVKYKILRDELLRAIRAGEFVAGQRLPAERELAVRFKVTHMTVRQAVSELVDFELLERRSRMGVYVRAHSREKLSTTTLNLICSVGDSSLTSSFLKFGTDNATERGWRTRITRSLQGYEIPLVRAVKSGEPSLIFLDLPGLSPALREAMIHANGRAVMFGNRFDDPAVPSILADDKLAMQMAVARLREAGHENIALVTSDPEHPVARVQIASWKACFADQVPLDVLDHRFIEISATDFQSAAESGYEAVSNYLRQPHADATAMIFTNDLNLFGALYACREVGRRVPEDMSLICTLDSDTLRFMQSGITVIDVCIEEQVKAAMDMIDAALKDELPVSERFRLIQPRLIDRNSVSHHAASSK